MLPVLSREQMQQLDRATTERWNVPSAVLMENAGRGAAEIIAATLPPKGRVVAVTGCGNNGGDGFVVARHLLVLGHEVAVLALCAPTALKGDARHNCEAFVALGGQILECTVVGAIDDQIRTASAGAQCVVDAIFGVGLSREVEGVFAQAIVAINALREVDGNRPQIVALDIPSGLDATTGQVLGAAVRADQTLSFAQHKLGMFTANGVDHCGQIRTIDIGVPAGALEEMEFSARLLQDSDIHPLLKPRPLSAHKNSAGRVVVFAGSAGKIGAALLVGRAALRAGAGVVTLAGFEEVVVQLDRRVEELMTARIDRAHVRQSVESICTAADAVVVGPGVGLDDAAQELVRAILAGFKGSIVVDADALTQFAGKVAEFSLAPGSLILTPHPGEMGRLLGMTGAQVENDRFSAVSVTAQRGNCTVLLKGPCTLIASPGQRTLIHSTQAPSLATAGSGDVLAGIIGALCLTLSPWQAAFVGAHVHARAAQLWQAENQAADRGLLAHEIADHVPAVIAELTRRSASLPV
ncbi:MAG TPA: NAD(P)H-hydrate dehydratase [Polyangiaceae bacterium]|nr:NAD(P)H-hydrate dehydratase [Polyangiaceae bacterium]